MTKRGYVEWLQAERKKMLTSDLNCRDFSNLLIEIAEKINSSSTHFIFELIQNAEDNAYDEGVTPTLTFQFKHGIGTDSPSPRLVITNNERGFRQHQCDMDSNSKHVEGICRVGNSTKEKRFGYIGEKGIGFKSVFKVTHCPEVHSNGFHFRLPDAETDDIHIGYVVPHWVSPVPTHVLREETTIILPLDKTLSSAKEVVAMLRDFAPETILFLSILRKVCICIDGKERVIEKVCQQATCSPTPRTRQQQPQGHIAITGRHDSLTAPAEDYWVATLPFVVPEGFDLPDERKGIVKRDLTIAIPLKSSDEEHCGKLFAYLPVWDDAKPTGLPFLINGDFLLTSNREDLTGCPWNDWIRSQIPCAYVKALLSCLRSSLPLESRVCAYSSIPLVCHKPFLAPALDRIRSDLQTAPCVLTRSGGLQYARLCRFADKDWHDLLEASCNPPRNFMRQLVHPLVDTRYGEQLGETRGIGVRDLKGDDIRKCLRNTAWLERQSDQWLLRLYELLAKRKDLGDLTGIPLVPVRPQGAQGRLLPCDEGVSAYFEIDEDDRQVLSSAPTWLHALAPVEVVEPKFIGEIEGLPEEKRSTIRKWMVETVKVRTFKASEYWKRLLKGLGQSCEKLTPQQIVEATRFLLDRADGGWEYLPVILSNGRLVRLREVKKEAWSVEGCEPATIQSVVVPESYDPDTGWQHIWVTDEDRRHFVWLSDAYPADIVGEMEEQKIIDAYPSIQQRTVRRDRRSISEVSLTQHPPSSLQSPSVSWGLALAKWIGYRSARTPVDWPRGTNSNDFDVWKWDHALKSSKRICIVSPDIKWALDLVYAMKGETIHLLNKSQDFRSKCSALVDQLRTETWLPTTMGLKQPCEAYVDDPNIRDVLGDGVPYVVGTLRTEIVKLLRINTSTRVPDLVEELKRQSTNREDADQLAARIYRRLAAYDEAVTPGLVDSFRDNALLLTHQADNTTRWRTSGECVWADARDVFGDDFGYLGLEQEYRNLQSFFVDRLNVKPDIDVESYWQHWRQLQDSQRPIAEGKMAQVEHLYRKLRSKLETAVTSDVAWIKDFEAIAKPLATDRRFLPRGQVFCPDDGEYQRLFEGRVAYVWYPGVGTNEVPYKDWQGFCEKLGVQRLSRCVTTDLEDDPTVEQLPVHPLLTACAFEMIGAWLWNKLENSERDTAIELLHELMKCDVFRSTTVLRVRHTLIGTQEHASGMTTALRDRKSKKLLVHDERSDKHKRELARHLARRLHPGEGTDLAHWIEMVLGATNAERLADDNWDAPESVRARCHEKVTAEKGTDQGEEDCPPVSAEDQDQKHRSGPATNLDRSAPLGGPSPSPPTPSRRAEPATPSSTPMEAGAPCARNARIEAETLLPLAFSRSGEHSLAPDYEEPPTAGRSKNPDRRGKKLEEQYRERMANEPSREERLVPQTVQESSDPKVRGQLEKWYRGRCQICDGTFPKSDASPHFVAAYLIERQNARAVDDPGNAVCLCAEHSAQWRFAAKDTDLDVLQWVRDQSIPFPEGKDRAEIPMRIAGQDVRLKFCQDHLQALQKLLVAAADGASSTI